MATIKHFTELVAWQKAYALSLSVYSVTKNFPKTELFGLTNQIRRASVSISSNIAEGFARHSARDKYHFCSIARGSACEVESQLRIAFGLNYIEPEVFEKLIMETVEVQRTIAGLAKASRGRMHI